MSDIQIAASRPPKESKVQRHERLKGEQNPWEELPRLFPLFRAGAGALGAADRDMRLRWWGLYTQGDGAGVFGGSAPYYMLRLRLPNGHLTGDQLATLASMTRRYARGVADVTVRQNLQWHWIQAEDIPDIFHELWDIGLTTRAACGDDTRNVTGCPLAGFDPDEIVDARPFVEAINRELISHAEFYNLPRKFKICASGCRHWCPLPEINDVAFTALQPKPGREGEIGFGLQVGGGLSTTPHFAVPIPVVVRPHQVVDVARALARLFRDRTELRQNRAQARFKFLFMKFGWDAARLRSELEANLGYRLESHIPDPPPAHGFRDHLGANPQRQAGLFSVGASVLGGRLTADQMERVAELARDLAGDQVRTTALQNLLLPNVPKAHVARLTRQLTAVGLPVAASSFRRGTIACTGSEFCKLAVVETKQFAAELVAELERRLPQYPEPIRINLNGCPNSCGQHWIADIGLQGTRVKTATVPEDGYDVFLGGGLGQNPTLARRTLGRVRARELPDRLEALLRFYAERRLPDERFRAFVQRTPNAELEAVLGSLPEAPAHLPVGQLVRIGEEVAV